MITRNIRKYQYFSVEKSSESGAKHLAHFLPFSQKVVNFVTSCSVSYTPNSYSNAV